MLTKGTRTKLNGKWYRIVGTYSEKKHVVCSLCQRNNGHMPCLVSNDYPDSRPNFTAHDCNLLVENGCYPKEYGEN